MAGKKATTTQEKIKQREDKILILEEKIQKMTDEVDKLKAEIKEINNLEIIGLIEEYSMTPEELRNLLRAKKEMSA